jgi:gluconolactonase
VRGRVAFAAGLLAALAAAPPALAVPDCAVLPQARVVVTDQGRLESIASDAAGRLFYTDATADRLLRLDAPGAQPVVVATAMARPGGLAFDSDGSLVAGFNGGALAGVPENGRAGLFRVDPETGAKQVVASGLDQANGVVRGPDGAIYASNNIAGEIARIAPDGTIDEAWAQLDSPNGLALDAAGGRLLAAQTFRPANVAAVPLADPARPSTHYAAPLPDVAAGLDGVALDGAGRLYAAANGAGEVWRIEPDGSGACALARGLGLPSAVGFGGGGGGFGERNLYVVTFTGRVVELADATDAPPAAGS